MLSSAILGNRSLWADRDALEGDVGCRAIIRGRPEAVVALPAAAGPGHPIDIDTPEDYDRLVGRDR